MLLFGAPRPGETIGLSCVLDNTPSIWSSFLPWLATALELAQIPPSCILVHHACPLRQDVADLCARLGVVTHSVDPFDARSPHSNKIRQLETDFGAARRILLTDVDVVFSRPLPCERIGAAVAGKTVDRPKPPLEVLEIIFAHSGIPTPDRCTNRLKSQGQTLEFSSLVGNFNGGLYLIGSQYARALGARWRYWAHWLLDNIALLGHWKINVDQVSFCLALKDSGFDSLILGDEWNFPTHIEMPPVNEEPYVIHHHARLDNHQRLLSVLDDPPRRAIERVNQAIEKFQRQYFDNRTFWNHRYTFYPDRGSGIGSRGEALYLKRDLLSRAIPPKEGLTILDWGCGDIELTSGFPWNLYVGVDVSVEALRVAKEKRSDWHFATPEQFDADDGMTRDLVLCIDVLIHQPTREQYFAMLDKVVSLARIGLVVSGYDRPPKFASFITYFHEPLKAVLSRRNDVIFLVQLTEYRDTAVYFVAKKVTNVFIGTDFATTETSSGICALVYDYIHVTLEVTKRRDLYIR